MAALDMFRRGWGWVWLLGLAEAALLAPEVAALWQAAPAVVRPSLTTPRSADTPARVSLQPIIDFQPFGTPAVPEPVVAEAVPEVEAVPETPMTDGYVLQGVLFSDKGVPSRAILAWNGGAPASFVAGDVLPSGATLAAVEANRVGLTKDGDTQFLEFPASVRTLQSPADSEPTTQTDATATAPPPQAKAPTMPQPDLQNLIPGLGATAPGNN